MKIYSEYSFWWIALIFILAVFIAYIQYYYYFKTSVFSKHTKFILSVIRFFIIFIIGILLLNFYSKFFKNEYIKPVLILAVDNSESMISAKDSDEVKEFFNEKFYLLKQSLEEKFDVQTITFGEKIRLNNDSLKFKELKTNPENIFSETQQILGNKSVSAMLMITDGIFNEGVHPVSLADNISYPVYIAATGDTNVYKDVGVKKILCNKNVFIGNDFIAEVLIHSSAVKDEKVKVNIYEGKNAIAEKEILINSEKSDLSSQQFQLPANKGGYHTYKVVVSHLKDEKNIQNNTSYFVVNVIENKTKVLFLYSAPHPDISAVRQILNNSPQYETEVYSENMFTKEISKYDVVIYHSPNSNSVLFEKCLQSGIPLFIITTQLNVLQNKFVSVRQISPVTNEIECQLNSSFSAFSLTDEYAEMINQLPVIYAPYGNYSVLGEADILYFQKINNVFTNLPLFFLTQTAYGKYALFLGDGLWRWKMSNYQIKKNTDWFSHLITQCIRYLSVKRDKSLFKVFVPATISENEPLQMTAEIYNESMQLTTEPDVLVTLKDEKNAEYKFVFNKSNSNYFLNAGVLPYGEYQYKAYTQYKSKEYTQSGKIHIVPLSVEKNNLTAQHQSLKTLANKTSGQFYLLKDYEKILQDLDNNEDIKNIVVQNETYQYWIDNRWFFVIIVLLSVSEWIIRRWYGVI